MFKALMKIRAFFRLDDKTMLNFLIISISLAVDICGCIHGCAFTFIKSN